jgi:hypothetical protein
MGEGQAGLTGLGGALEQRHDPAPDEGIARLSSRKPPWKKETRAAAEGGAEPYEIVVPCH